MSSSDYPTINYNVFIPSNWSPSSSGFTEAQLDRKYLKFPIAQPYTAETLNNVNLNGTITTTKQSPLLIQNPLFNQVVGSNSNLSNITGGKNTSWGNSTFDNLSSGIDNTSVGYRALNSIFGYNENTAIGSDALRLLTTGEGNTSVGFKAGENMTINSDGNTFLGHKCGTKIFQNNDYNTFLGATSDLSSITLNLNKSTAVGYGSIITASNQVVLGTSTESVYIPSGNIYTPSNNINISSNKTLTLGNFNVAIGLAALQGGNASTANNNAVGYGALVGSKASNNTAIGHYALPNVSSGGNNTAIGANAGGINGGIGLNIGTDCTFLGANTNVILGATGASKSTAIGAGAIITESNQVVLGTSTEKVVIPSGIIQNTTTNFNTLIGSTGSYSIGGYNTCLGFNAMAGSGNASTENNTCVGYNSGNKLNAGGTTNQGSANSLFGRGSGSFLTTGAYNTFVGSQSGYDATIAVDNVCIGSGSGDNLIEGSTNTFIGKGTNTTLSSVNNSTAIGYNAQITANNQIVLGTSAETIIVPNRISCSSIVPITASNASCVITNNIPNISSGTYNVGMGWGSFTSLTSGSNNTFLGTTCLPLIITNTNNTAIGNNSLSIVADGSNNENTAIGSSSGANFSLGSKNTFLGSTSGFNNSVNNFSNSTAVGYASRITASNQVVLGTSTETIIAPSGIITNLKSNLTNGGNTFISSRTLTNNNGRENTAIGIDAFGVNASANSLGNTAVGASSLKAVAGTSTANQACDNTAIGRNTGLTITIGSKNTIIGSDACNAVLISGNQNTFIGSGTSIVGSTTSQSTAIGYNAQITASNQVVLGTSTETVIVPNRISCSSAVPMVLTNSSGNNIITNTIPVLSGTAPNGTNNTAFGNSCLSAITTGYQNTCFGAGACPFNDTSFSNTAIGTGALGSLASNIAPGNNSQNTAIGTGAGNNFTNGANNTFLGYFTGINNSANTYNQSTAIGYNATITASNQIVLGTSNERVIIPNNATMSGSLTLTSRTIIGLATPITASITLTFPLSEVYYITPSTTINTPIAITLPTITSGTNNGAKVCFRVVNINAVTGSGVTINTTGAVANIYNSTTSTTGVASHTIYTTNTTNMLSHTFYCLPTTLGGNTIGWFQQGGV
jgi:hypothetical protein